MLDFSKISYVGQSTGSSRSKSSEPNWPVVQLQTTGFKQARSLWFSKLALKELGVDLEQDARPFVSFWSMDGQMGFLLADEDNHVGTSFKLGKVSQKVNCKPAYNALCKHFNLQTEAIMNEGEDTGDITLVQNEDFSFNLVGEHKGRKYYVLEYSPNEETPEVIEEQRADAQMATIEQDNGYDTPF